MSLTKIYIASQYVSILIKEKIYIINFKKNVMSLGIIIDNEKFIDQYRNFFSKNKLRKQFWCKEIMVIYNASYHLEDINNLDKVFKELNYRKVKLVCEKDIIDYRKKEVLLLIDDTYRIFYIDKYNTKKYIILDPRQYTLNEIMYLLKNRSNNKLLYIIGKNYLKYEGSNYYIIDNINEFFLKKDL